MEAKRERDPSTRWTNERHMDYLNSMEDSFVQTMLESNGPLLRLDRYVPDSSESTVDSKLPERRKRRRHSTPSDVHIPYPKTRTDMKPKRQSSQPHTSSQDQVVPQLVSNGLAHNGGKGRVHVRVPTLLWRLQPTNDGDACCNG